MLGDELKKSLEPIQTSDELLAKTRAAIEKARLEQAAASLNGTASASSRKKRPFRYSYFLMAAIPVLCVALLVGGLIFLLPRMSKSATDMTKSKRSKNSRSTSVVAAAEAVDNGGEKSTDVEDVMSGSDASAEWTMPDAVENTTEAEDLDKNGETEVKDEPSETTAADDKHFVRPTPDIPFTDAQTVVAGEYLVCIADDRKSLFLCDKKTGDIIPESDELVIPAIEDLHENETITGLFYSDETESLYIIVSDSTKDTADRKIYVCPFANGSSDGSAPSLVSEN